MKRVSLIVAASLVSTPAVAQDAVDWSGPYIGINAGLGFGTSEHSYDEGTLAPTFTTPPPLAGYPMPNAVFTPGGVIGKHGNFNLNGATVGVQAGYNVQIKKVVLGVEADFSTGIDGTTKGPAANPCLASFSDSNGYCTTKIKNFGSVRGRIGYTANKALVYATAGYGFAKLNAVRPFTNVEQNRSGFVWGGGVEYALSNHLSANIDYTRIDLGNKQTYSSIPLSPPYLTYTVVAYPNGVPNHFVDAKINSVKIGLNYRF